VDENTLGEIGDYSATASDGSDVTYELTGSDAADFYVSNFEDNAGTVYYERRFDFENPDDKTLSFTVNATAGSATVTKDVTVTVNDKNDRPAFSSRVFECTLRENARAGSRCGAHWGALAADDDDTTLTYSLSDLDWRLAEWLDIVPSTGALTLSAAGADGLDFEARSGCRSASATARTSKATRTARSTHGRRCSSG